MSSPTSIRTTAAIADLPGFASEGRRLKIAPDSYSKGRTVVPDTALWKELKMGTSLSRVLLVEGLVRSGKASVVILPEPTSSCKEKAQAAGIPLESVIKTLCCKDEGDKTFIVVATSNRRVDLPGLSRQHEEIDGLSLAPETLPGMKSGTCTPFVSRENLANIAYLMVQAPSGGLEDRTVDVALGGTDEIAHRLSLSVRYADLITSLVDAYGERVKFFDTETKDILPSKIREPLKLLEGNPRRPKRYSPRLKAIKRIEKLAGAHDIGDEGMAAIISELAAVEDRDRSQLVREEARRVYSTLAARL